MLQPLRQVEIKMDVRRDDIVPTVYLCPAFKICTHRAFPRSDVQMRSAPSQTLEQVSYAARFWPIRIRVSQLVRRIRCANGLTGWLSVVQHQRTVLRTHLP